MSFLQELRVEDYLAGRKGQELQTTGFRIAFPVTSTQQSAAFTLEASEHTGFGTTSRILNHLVFTQGWLG
ncbi:hypothetical protein DPMN_147180 [Dreissena polymorpha]|uniref:Uncharacterized protein n=1 Tax=Dreissena polymorpha TaxID=45954 RepID=A0A9D4FA22_DREPO|nr:hypothetical protein DPMN_147180 [Dreissena polymorpha]